MATPSYTIRLDNYSQIQELFARAPARITSEVHKAVQKSILLLENAIKREAPVNKQSGGGNLRQSIASSMTGTAAGKVIAAAGYSAFVEFGTRPHEIRPVRANVLASRTGGTRSGGEYTFFGKLVHHPGTAPNPFFKRGIDKSMSQIQAYFGQAVFNALKP